MGLKLRRPKPLLTFVQDSREQNPFTFGAPVRSEFADGGSVVEGLESGDYSVRLDDELLSIRIERKSLGDLFGCCGFERDRFVRELERLTAYDQRDLVIEATANHILTGYERSRIPGRSVMASLACWRVQFGLAVWFGENHRRAGGLTQRILEEFAIHYYRNIQEAECGEPVVRPDSGGSDPAMPSDSVRLDAGGKT
jgi:DNA excision repair protein ERCC-4